MNHIPGGSNEFLEHEIFSVCGRTFSGADVILAARFWGDWFDLENRVNQQLACVRKMEATQDLPEELQLVSEAQEFRYKRNLITAEETENWLKQHFLTTEIWMDHILRSLLLRKWQNDLSVIVAKFPVTAEEVDSVIHSEAICSGDFDRFTHKLAGRAALYEASGKSKNLESNCETGQILREFESFFVNFREQNLVPAAIEREIGSHSLDWVRFQLDILSFPDRQMALEAVHCFRDDGKSIVEIASEARVIVERSTVFFEDLNAKLCDALMGAQKGNMIGPIKIHDGYSTIIIIDKIIPTIHDLETRRKAEEVYLQKLIDQEVRNRVKGL